jgi:hypothetical protein
MRALHKNPPADYPILDPVSVSVAPTRPFAEVRGFCRGSCKSDVGDATNVGLVKNGVATIPLGSKLLDWLSRGTLNCSIRPGMLLESISSS